MPDDSRTIGAIDWRSAFPFTHLFRSFRIARHPNNLFLALVALLLLYAGGRTLDGMWGDRKLTRAETVAVYGEDVLPRPSVNAAPGVGTTDMLGERVGPFVGFFDYEAAQVNYLSQAVAQGAWLVPGGVVNRVMNFLAAGPATAFATYPFFFTLFSVWFLLVWSIFGGAIARVAAVHVARDEKISIRQALRFSTGKLLSFVFAPLIPLMIIGAIALLIAVGGLLNYLPWGIGPVLVSLLFVLTLVVGFVMTLVIFGTVGGFNLMYPTIAVEGSDSFDAISRSFSYVYARPWRMLFYTAVALAYGALTYLFVRLFLWTLLALVHHFEAGFLKSNGAAYATWQAMWPPPELLRLPYDIDHSQLTNPATRTAAGILSFWIYLTISLLGAYAISFYFSVNTVIYYLMRQEVDATEMDDVFIEQTDDEFLEAPPAGAEPAAPGTDQAGVAGPAMVAPPAAPGGGGPAPSRQVEADGPEHTPPQAMPGPQTDNPPGETLTYSAPSDAPPVTAAEQDPQAEKRPDGGA